MEDADLSPFERLPGEIRNLIYEFCIDDDENTKPPLPTQYELETLPRRRKRISHTTYEARVRQAPDTAKSHSQPAIPKWPAVPLLSVNHLIRNEVLGILFGSSVRHLSCQFTMAWGHSPSPWPGPPRSAILHKPYLYWEKYGKRFRHISSDFSRMNVSHHYILKCSRTDQTKETANPLEGRNDQLVEILFTGPIATKLCQISHMTNLRLIQIDLGLLACHRGCCRTPVLEKLISLWTSSIVGRIHSWGPTKAFVKRMNKRSFRCYIKGQSGALGVRGLWTELEAEMILKHWWRPGLSPEKRERVTKTDCTEQDFEEFWADADVKAIFF